jgi:hypothetical protein
LQAPAGQAQEEQLQEVHWSPILIDYIGEKFLKFLVDDLYWIGSSGYWWGSTNEWGPSIPLYT